MVLECPAPSSKTSSSNKSSKRNFSYATVSSTKIAAGIPKVSPSRKSLEKILKERKFAPPTSTGGETRLTNINFALSLALQIWPLLLPLCYELVWVLIVGLDQSLVVSSLPFRFLCLVFCGLLALGLWYLPLYLLVCSQVPCSSSGSVAVLLLISAWWFLSWLVVLGIQLSIPRCGTFATLLYSFVPFYFQL